MYKRNIDGPKFGLGQIVATPGVIDAFDKAYGSQGRFALLGLLHRHASTDWGTVDGHDKQANDTAVKHGQRILSQYNLLDDTRIWIITEADRATTTILLRSEY